MSKEENDWSLKNSALFEGYPYMNVTTSGMGIPHIGYVKKRSIIQLILHIDPNKPTKWLTRSMWDNGLI